MLLPAGDTSASISPVRVGVQTMTAQYYRHPQIFNGTDETTWCARPPRRPCWNDTEDVILPSMNVGLTQPELDLLVNQPRHRKRIRVSPQTPTPKIVPRRRTPSIARHSALNCRTDTAERQGARRERSVHVQPLRVMRESARRTEERCGCPDGASSAACLRSPAAQLARSPTSWEIPPPGWFFIVAAPRLCRSHPPMTSTTPNTRKAMSHDNGDPTSSRTWCTPRT